MKTVKKRSFCPISSALDILGDKWSLLIIRDLMFENKRTYGEFIKGEEGIATNILADRLALLESAAIIRKREHAENRTKYVYSLTQKGIDLMPVLLELILWSDRYNTISLEARSFARQIRKEKETIIHTKNRQLKKLHAALSA